MRWYFWPILAIGIILFLYLNTWVISFIIYYVLLIRSSKKRWTREVSYPFDEEYTTMHNMGLEWEAPFEEIKKDVSIESCGYKLCGEYFDFGFDKCVITIAGRMEACRYGYFFAKPYYESGYNLLCIDNRAHGLSEGRVASLGFKEYKDIQNWCRMLESDYGIKTVVLHAICIGSEVGMFALTDKECPSNLKGMVAEGMFTTFGDSLEEHLKDLKKPIHPFKRQIAAWIKLISKADILNDGPLYRIDKLDKPLLMLHSKEDLFSLPYRAQILYDKAVCPKQIVWFDKGAHSRIRINNLEKYDNSIKSFLAEYF